MCYQKQFFHHQTQTKSDLLSPGESLTPASTPHAELYGAKVVVEGQEKTVEGDSPHLQSKRLIPS